MFGVDNGHRSVSGGLARAAVFGVNDGLVSSAALILGFAGSGVDSSCPAAGSNDSTPARTSSPARSKRRSLRTLSDSSW